MLLLIASSTLAAPTSCPPGSYLNGVECATCAAGFWGTGTTSFAAGPECSGACLPGYHCSPGSASPSAAPCGSAADYCPLGRRLAVGAGYFTTPESAPSTLRTGAERCPVGSYCVEGLRTLCAGGRYGETTGLATAECSGEARAGTYAPPGSQLPLPCPTRHFCLRSTVVAQPCPAGTYGASLNLTSAACSGRCTPGYYCPPRSASATEVPCPAGRYGASHGLADAACDGPAAPGYWTSAASTNATAQRCGSSTVFCPSGSAAPLPVAPGHYSTDVNTAHLAPSVSAPSVATDGHVVNAEALTEKEARAANVAQYASAEARAAAVSGEVGGGKSTLRIAVHQTAAGQAKCAAGTFCSARGIGGVPTSSGGVRMPCPIGRFASTGASACDQRCPPGTYCVEGSAAPALCPAGRYGATFALGNAGCTGASARGHFTDAGSVSATQSPCPAGRFGHAEGLTSVAACGDLAQAPGLYAAPGQAEPHRCGAGDASCAAGATAPRRVLPGYYSRAGAMDAAQGGGKVGDATRRGEQLPCPPGHFCKRARKRRCAAGRWSSGTVAGGARATNSSACEGACAPGYWCPSGSASPRERACPAGRYAAIAGSRSAACEGACAPGHFCAAASVSRTAALCSAADSSVYCPEGTTAQQRAPEGWWTQTLPLSRMAQIAEMESRNASLRSTIERCDVGFWCSAGVRAPCPAGALCRCDVMWTSSSCPSPPPPPLLTPPPSFSLSASPVRHRSLRCDARAEQCGVQRQRNARLLDRRGLAVGDAARVSNRSVRRSYGPHQSGGVHALPQRRRVRPRSDKRECFAVGQERMCVILVTYILYIMNTTVLNQRGRRGSGEDVSISFRCILVQGSLSLSLSLSPLSLSPSLSLSLPLSHLSATFHLFLLFSLLSSSFIASGKRASKLARLSTASILPRRVPSSALVLHCRARVRVLQFHAVASAACVDREVHSPRLANGARTLHPSL